MKQLQKLLRITLIVFQLIIMLTSLLMMVETIEKEKMVSAISLLVLAVVIAGLKAEIGGKK